MLAPSQSIENAHLVEDSCSQVDSADELLSGQKPEVGRVLQRIYRKMQRALNEGGILTLSHEEILRAICILEIKKFPCGVRIDTKLMPHLYMRGGVIDGDFLLHNVAVTHLLDLRDITVHGALILDKSYVRDLLLDGAHIPGGIWFNNSMVEGDLSLSDSSLGNLDMRNFYVTGGVDLSNSRVQGDVSLARTVVWKGWDQHGANIEGDIYGSASQILGRRIITGSIIDGIAL